MIYDLSIKYDLSISILQHPSSNITPKKAYFFYQRVCNKYRLFVTYT